MMEWEEERRMMEAHCAQAEKLVAQMKDMPYGSARAPIISQIQSILAKGRLQLKSYMLEIKTLDAEGQMKHQRPVEELNMRFRKIQNDFESFRSDRAAMIDEAANLPPSVLSPADQDAAQQLASVQRQGDQIQDKTQSALERTRAQAQETQGVARDIEEQLAAQEEQLLEVDKQFDEMQDNLTRSKKFMAVMLKSASHDRCMQILGCLNVVGFLTIIGLYAAGV